VIPHWRLTRNRYARRVYDALAAVGVTATRMVEFEATVSGVDAQDPTPDHRSTISVGTDEAADVSVVAVPAGDPLVGRLDLDFSIPVSVLDDEWVVVARTGDRAVGRALVSAGQRPYVKPLGRELSFDGAYVRRVFVAPAWRNEGVATRLVRTALAVAGSELGTGTAHALVAADNKPSQWVFEATGFRPVRCHDYVRLAALEYRRTTDRR